MKNNSWEDKLKHRFDDFESTLREEQWDRLESALVQPKVNRFKRWILFMLAAGLVGTGFTIGYWVAQANQSNVSSPANYVSVNADDMENSIKVETIEKTMVSKNSIGSNNDLNTDESQNREKSVWKNSLNNRTLKDKNATKILDKSNPSLIPSIEENAKDLDSKFHASQKELSLASSSRGPSFKPVDLMQFGLPNPVNMLADDLTIARGKTTEQTKKSRFVLNPILGYYTSRTNVRDDDGIFTGDLAVEIASSLENQSLKGNGMRLGLEALVPVYKGLNLSAGFVYNHQRIQNNFIQIHRIMPVYHDSFSNVIVGFEKLSDDAAPRTEVNIDNRISMLQLPFKLHYEIPVGAKFNLGVSAGYQFNVPLQMDLNFYDILNFEYRKMDDGLYKLGGQQMAGMHFYYQLSHSVDVGLNYTFARTTNSINFMGYQVKLANQNHMFDFGLRVHL